MKSALCQKQTFIISLLNLLTDQYKQEVPAVSLKLGNQAEYWRRWNKPERHYNQSEIILRYLSILSKQVEPVASLKFFLNINISFILTDATLRLLIR